MPQQSTTKLTNSGRATVLFIYSLVFRFYEIDPVGLFGLRDWASIGRWGDLYYITKGMWTDKTAFRNKVALAQIVFLEEEKLLGMIANAGKRFSLICTVFNPVPPAHLLKSQLLFVEQSSIPVCKISAEFPA
jgi:hypothetical protein